MSNGVLSFTLGLEASNFLRNLGMASGQILGLASVGQVVQSTFRGVWAEIERGGALNDLSARTGQSVGVLYKLQEAFKAAGLESGNVAPMILRMQKALTGMDENGNKTDKVFEKMGLSLSRLRQMDAPGQFEAVSKALMKLGSADAAGAASQIFGRERAGDMLQMARGAQGFTEAMKQAGVLAPVYARTAELFDNLGDTITRIKSQMGGLWALLGERMAPAMQGIADQISKELTIAFMTIDLGKFGEYFSLTLKAGVQEAMDLLVTKLQESGLFGDKGGGSGSTGSKVGKGALGVGAGLLALGGEAGALLGVPGAREMADKRFDQANRLFEAAGIKDGILQSLADAAQRGVEGKPNEFLEALKALREEMLEAAHRLGEGRAVKVEEDVNEAGLGGKGKKGGGVQDVSALEKIGFVLRGAAGGDYQRQTAEHTRSMVRLLTVNNELLKAKGVALVNS